MMVMVMTALKASRSHLKQVIVNKLVFQYLSHVGCDAVSLDVWFPAFRKFEVPSFFFRKCLLDCLKLKMKALLRFRIPGATDAWRHKYTALRASYVVSYLKRYIHLSAYGATTASGPWPPLKDPSTHLCLLLVSCFLLFLGSSMHPSGRRPPIFFLVFLLIL